MKLRFFQSGDEPALSIRHADGHRYQVRINAQDFYVLFRLRRFLLRLCRRTDKNQQRE
jgi:hypothetical protein